MKEYCKTNVRLGNHAQAMVGTAFSSPTTTASQPPDIIIKGFHDLQHFLSWFQIDASHAQLFPDGQMRSLTQHSDCIVIHGFHDLEEFLAFFRPTGQRRPPIRGGQIERHKHHAGRA